MTLTQVFASTVINVDNGGAPAWTSPSNAEGDTSGTYANCNISGSPLSDYLTATAFPDFPTLYNITSVQYYIEQRRNGTSADGTLQLNDGTGWCVGHQVNFTSIQSSNSANCFHFVWDQTKIDAVQMRVKVDNTDGATWIRTYRLRVRVTHFDNGYQIVQPQTGASGTWDNPENVYQLNYTLCTHESIGSGFSTSEAQLGNFTLPDAGTITAAHIQVQGNLDATYGQSAGFRLSRDGGATWCSAAHFLGGNDTGTCVGAQLSGWTECTHDFSNITRAQARSNDLLVDWRIDYIGDPTGDVNYKKIEVRLTFDLETAPNAPTWAAQPFPLANRDLTELEVDWVAPGAGDDPSGYDLQWDTDSSFPTPPTQTIDVGLVTIYNHTGRSSGTRYYYRVRGYNTGGDGSWSTTESTYTEPVQPTGLAVVNTVAQRLDLSWNAVTVSPAGTVLYDIQWDADSGAGGETNLSLNQSATTVNHTVGADNTLRYYWVRAQSPDVDGNGTTEGQYNTKVAGTTWSVPTTENLSSATTPDDSMILVTRDSSYPSGGAGNPPEGVDSWEVWRSTTSGGAYSELVAGLTATTYQDWSVDGGETWFYKAKFTNLIGDSSLSASPVNATATTSEVDGSGGFTLPYIARWDMSTTGAGVDFIGSRNLGEEGGSGDWNNTGGYVDSRWNSGTPTGEFIFYQGDLGKDGTQDFSALAFFKCANWINSDTFFEFWESSTKFARAYVGTSGTIVYIWSKIDGTDDFVSTGWAPADDTWYLVYFTHDETTNDEFRLKIYDGNSFVVNIVDPDNGSLDLSAGSAQITMTAFESGSNAAADMDVSNPAIFSSVLTDQEIIDYWNEDFGEARGIITSDTTIQGISEDSKQVTRITQRAEKDSRQISREVKAVKSRQVTRTVQLDGRSSRQISRVVQRAERDSRQVTRIVQIAVRDSRSISRIVFILQEFTKTSDAWIMKIGEISRVSNTTIYKLGLSITKISETAIFREGFVTLDITSDARIKDTFEETIISDSRIKNTYEQSPLSDSAIFRSQYGNIQVSSDARIVLEGTTVVPPIYSDSRILIPDNELTKTSDTFIVLGQEITKSSDTAIFQADYGDIIKLSDTAIFRAGYNDITKLSDTTIFKSGLLIDKLSDTRIFRPGGYMYPFQDQEKTSDTRILALGQEITKKSLTRIKDDSNDILKLSDTLIILNPVINKTSDTKIKFLDNALLILSSTRIKNTGEVSTLSDAAIFRSQYGDITKLSDTLILREPIIDKTSDTTIVKLFEFSGIPSDTYIINIGTQIDINSDTAIFRASYGHIIKESRTAIKTDTPLEMTKLSNTRIKKTVTLNKVSDTAIRRDRSPMVAIFRKSRQL